jgi:hypothetical protein
MALRPGADTFLTPRINTSYPMSYSPVARARRPDLTLLRRVRNEGVFERPADPGEEPFFELDVRKLRDHAPTWVTIVVEVPNRMPGTVGLKAIACDLTERGEWALSRVNQEG